MLCCFLLFFFGFLGWLLVFGNVSVLFLLIFSEGYYILSNNVVQIWNELEYYDLYVLVIIWYVCFVYDKEKIDKYNECLWGVGFGVLCWDEKGNWYGLYLMVFKDFFNKWEFIGGYGWEKIWCLLMDQNFYFGFGYIFGVMVCDNWNYILILVILLLVLIGYGLVIFQMIYIFGIYNNGNVYFVWVCIQF